MSKFTLLLAALGASARLVHIKNDCPADIELAISGSPQGVLPSNHTIDKTFAKSEAAFIYTTSRGGFLDGRATVRAAFDGDAQSEVYYLVYDPIYINMAMSITPHVAGELGGFCAPATCNEQSCLGGLNKPLVGLPPLVPGVAPNPPLYACLNDVEVEYTVTFCPGGKYPDIIAPAALRPAGDSLSKCLDVRSYNVSNGEVVQLYDCTLGESQRWLFKWGSTKIRLAESNFCLDAGSNPGNGVGMKIWQCYDNLPAQAWYLTNDGRVALEGQGQCLDVTNGGLWSGNQMQTWQCTDSERNQEWIPIYTALPW